MNATEYLHHAVAEAMADIAAGDSQAIWELHRLATPTLQRMLRAEARRINAWISDDDLYDLVLDATFVLADRARSWRPEISLPWVWAKHRVHAVVHRHFGTFTRELDESHLQIAEPPAVVPIDDALAVLRSLAARHEGALALDRRLSEVAKPRDAEIYLGYLLERAAGNRRPAVTVGADHGMQPAAARKVVQRVGERLGCEGLAA